MEKSKIASPHYPRLIQPNLARKVSFTNFMDKQDKGEILMCFILETSGLDLASDKVPNIVLIPRKRDLERGSALMQEVYVSIRPWKII
jgi:hypothetical protein